MRIQNFKTVIEVRDTLWDILSRNAWDKVWYSFGRHIWDQTTNQFGNQVKIHIKNNLRSILYDEKSEFY